MLLVVRVQRDRHLVALLLHPPQVVPLSRLALQPGAVAGWRQLEATTAHGLQILLEFHQKKLRVVRHPQQLGQNFQSSRSHRKAGWRLCWRHIAGMRLFHCCVAVALCRRRRGSAPTADWNEVVAPTHDALAQPSARREVSGESCCRTGSKRAARRERCVSGVARCSRNCVRYFPVLQNVPFGTAPCPDRPQTLTPHVICSWRTQAGTQISMYIFGVLSVNENL